ncbi:MAG TPA: molybdate ABC transporter substrate-binding protein [Anaerolineales bacterium]|nr:molybdate ABC transporter substrate-binding protein [Anaerolineales bacterium]
MSTKKRGVRWAGFLLLTILLSACSAKQPAQPNAELLTLQVFAASSLSGAFTEIAEQFSQEHPNIQVNLNFAGSQILVAQIAQAVECDVFAPASLSSMEGLVKDGWVVEADSQEFAQNKLVVIVPADNPGNVTELSDLANAEIDVVLAAEEVPAGKYARQALEKMNSAFGESFSTRVLRNVISNEENVKQVTAKVVLGDVDAGIVYQSDSYQVPNLLVIPIDDPYNVPVVYPIAQLARSQKGEAAQLFISYVLGVDGQTILQKWGFLPKPS